MCPVKQVVFVSSLLIFCEERLTTSGGGVPFAHSDSEFCLGARSSSEETDLRCVAPFDP